MVISALYELLQDKLLVVFPHPTVAMQSSSATVVVAVVPLDREFVLPVLSVLAVLSSTLVDPRPDHSSIDKCMAPVAVLHTSVVDVSFPAATLYQIPTAPDDPQIAEIARVKPEMDASVMAP